MVIINKIHHNTTRTVINTSFTTIIYASVTNMHRKGLAPILSKEFQARDLSVQPQVKFIPLYTI